MTEKEVYVAQAGNAIKVGISNSPEDRVRHLNTGNAEEVRLVKTVDPLQHIGKSARAFESEVHNYLSQYHRSGEWFDAEALELLNQLLPENPAKSELSERQLIVLSTVRQFIDLMPSGVVDVNLRSNSVEDFLAVEKVGAEILNAYQIPHTVCVGCGNVVRLEESDGENKCPICLTVNND